MRVLVVADAYFPNKSSVAVLLADLTSVFLEQGIDVTVLVPSSDQDQSLIFSEINGCQIICVRALKTKDVGYFYRAFSEWFNPWLMWLRLRRDGRFMGESFHGIIWYSPTIFWGPLIKRLKEHFSCKTYLILRDIFPDWAMHLGLIQKGLSFSILKRIEKDQYLLADYIGVQSPNNLTYFNKNYPQYSSKSQVLWNWVKPVKKTTRLGALPLGLEENFFKKTIFVYVGNLGVSQDPKRLLELAEHLRAREDLGFLVIGRGSYYQKLKEQVRTLGLSSFVILDEISPDLLPSILDKCAVGIVLLDARHLTHNIPGKLITYLQSGLPVLAAINPGNDLVELIHQNQIGAAYTGNELSIFSEIAINLVEEIKIDEKISARTRAFAEKQFSALDTVKQISESLDLDLQHMEKS